MFITYICSLVGMHNQVSPYGIAYESKSKIVKQLSFVKVEKRESNAKIN